jgi:WD40 repeat protein
MEYANARAAILAVLKARGAATNSELVDAIGGDQTLFRRVREDLILNDLAEDKKGVGLILLGPPASVSAAPALAQTSAGPGAAPADADASAPAPPSRAGQRIFLSYGREDGSALADRLEEDLMCRGHQVWRDRSALRTGASWEAQIEDAILSHEVFVCLLTPHAVRRPDGVCLDEISMARYNDRKIVPAMVIQCRQPLGIYRLNWVDFQEWQAAARYEQAFAQLTAAIEQDAEVEGTCARIFSLLKPLDFGIEVSRLTRDFTGREWLFGRLDQWLDRPHSRVFLITGDPGTGKSAILATLVHRNPHVGAFHFCVSSLADSLDPLRFVRSVAAQFASQMPSYRTALNELDKEEFAETDPGSAFRRLIAGPLQRESPSHPVLLLVDALDESLRGGERNIAAMLRDRMDDLPSWVRIVASSRLQPEILDLFSDFSPEHIEAAGEENLGDIDRYVSSRLEDPALAELLRKSSADAGAVAERIKDRSEGNFLYVTQVLRGFESGRIEPQEIDRFPAGLVGIYQAFFERLFPAGHGFASTRALLNVLAAAREPLSAAQIARFLGERQATIELLLQKVAPFFPVRAGVCQPYHKSIVDWLTGEAGGNRMFRVDQGEGHRRIGTTLTADYRAGIFDGLVLSHLPAHLIEMGAWDDLAEVLTDLRFVAAKCAGGMTFDLVRDYEHAIDSLPELQEERVLKQEREAAIGRFVRSLVAFDRGAVGTLELPASLTPWNNERIEESEQRARTSPGRADIVRAFARFVAADAHHLARFGELPGFCLQQALNASASGPVAEAAARWAETKSLGPMLVKDPAYRPSHRWYPALVRVCEGHSKGVNGVAVNAMGTRAVSVGGDGEVRVWDLRSGECERVLKGHSAPVTSVALTPDGLRAVTGSEDRTVRVWDLRSIRCAAVLEGHAASVRGVAITPSGRTSVSVGSDQRLRVWSLDSGACTLTLSARQGKVSCVAISADGHMAVTGGGTGTVRVWDLTGGTNPRTLEGHTRPLLSVDITPDGRLAVSGSDDRTLRLWDVASGQLIRTMATPSVVPGVSISADGRFAASGSGGFDRIVRIWDLTTGTCIRSLAGHADSACAVRLTPDAAWLVSGSSIRDGTVGLWNLRNGLSTSAPEKHAGGVWSMAVDAECRVAVSGAGRRDKTLRVWDPDTGKTTKVLEGHAGAIWSAGLTADGRTAITGSEDGTARVWDLTAGACRAVLSGHKGHVWSVAVFPDSRRLATASQDRTARLWNLEDSRVLQVFGGHTDAVWSVTHTPDLRTIVSGSRDTTIRLWNARTGECVRTIEGHTGGIWYVAVSPDGRLLASASPDGTVRIWELATGRLRLPPFRHRGWVLTVGWSPDGTTVISSGHDKTLVVWNAATGQPVTVVPERSSVTVISRVRKSSRLFYGTSDGSVVGLGLRHVPTGTPYATALVPHPPASGQASDRRDQSPVAKCEWCGRHTGIADGVLRAIDTLRDRVGAPAALSPCLLMPREAWDDPGLLSACTQCGRPLRYTPFAAEPADDGSD